MIFVYVMCTANFKNQEFFQKSVELLTGYPPAQKMLGAPIITKKVEMGDWTKNYTDGLKAQVKKILPYYGCYSNCFKLFTEKLYKL